MEQESTSPQVLARDRALILGALALLAALSWAYLLRAPDHSREMGPAVAAAGAASRPPALEETQVAASEPEADDGDEDGVPRFP